MARPRAGVGGTHEAPSHSGGHAVCTDNRRIREERTLSRVYVAFIGKVIYAVITEKVFSLHFFSDVMRRPSIFIITLLPYDR